MRLIFILFFLGTGLLMADAIKAQTIGCPNVEIFKRITKETQNDYVKLNLFAMSNDCVLLSQQDKVEAIDYDPANSKTLYMKILYKKTGRVLFVPQNSIYVEQPGKKNMFRF